MIKVSVIVPVYNVEKYIDKCLESLVNQTLEEIEIIVVNDGSSDSSQKIIDKYVKKYPNKLKSYIKENGGQGDARNYGLAKASGEFIGYVDSDDYVELDMFQKMYEHACNNKSDVVICGNNVVDENYDVLSFESAYSYKNKLDIFNNLLMGKMGVWNKIYKKNIIVKNGIKFRTKVWYEDLDFTAKLMFLSPNISFVDEPLYCYLNRNGSTMNNNNITRNLEILLSFDELIKYMKEKNIYTKNYAELEFLAIQHIYIYAIVRILRTNESYKSKKAIINEMIEYMNLNFAFYKNNKYIKILSKRKQIIYFLIKNRLLILIELIFKIRGRK